MNRWKLSVICLILSVIGCGMPTAGMVKSPILSAAPVPSVNKDAVINTEVSTDVNMAAKGMINVRTSPGGEVVSYRLDGDILTIYGDPVTVQGVEWCRFTPDGKPALWVACQWLEAR